MKKRNRDELYVVLDTNVLLSHFWGGKTIQHIIDAMSDGTFYTVVSEDTLQEFREVGEREGFRKYFSWDIFYDFFDTYREISILVHPQKKVTASVDPKDNKFLECAVEAMADYLVSGDNDLLRIGHYEGVSIVTPSEFVKMVL